MRRRALILASMLAVTTGSAGWAGEIALPLGNLPSDSQTEMEKERGVHDLVLEHLVPGADYTYVVNTEYEALQAPPATPLGPPPPAAPAGGITCAEVLYAYQAERNQATTEVQVERAERKARGSAPDATCLDNVKQAIQRNTLTFPNAVTVRRKFVSEITIKRAKGADEETWTIEVRTGPGAVWTTMPVLAAVMDEGERYFSEAAPLTNEDGTTEERYRPVREDHGFEMRPGAGAGFFLVPEGQRESNWAHTFLAGFGLTDSATPLLGMVGYGMLIGDHVSISIGAATTWERQLLRRYRGQEFFSENLTNDQLTEEKLVVRPFFSIGIDFNGFDLSAGKKASPPDEN